MKLIIYFLIEEKFSLTYSKKLNNLLNINLRSLTYQQAKKLKHQKKRKNELKLLENFDYKNIGYVEKRFTKFFGLFKQN